MLELFPKYAAHVLSGLYCHARPLRPRHKMQMPLSSLRSEITASLSTVSRLPLTRLSRKCSMHQQNETRFSLLASAMEGDENISDIDGGAGVALVPLVDELKMKKKKKRPSTDALLPWEGLQHVRPARVHQARVPIQTNFCASPKLGDLPKLGDVSKGASSI